jgi:hypothetical protein
MKYAVEMGSDAMIYIPSFINICSGIQKLIGNGRIHTHTDISLLSFFQNKESRLNMVKLSLYLMNIIRHYTMKTSGGKYSSTTNLGTIWR